MELNTYSDQFYNRQIKYTAKLRYRLGWLFYANNLDLKRTSTLPPEKTTLQKKTTAANACKAKIAKQKSSAKEPHTIEEPNAWSIARSGARSNVDSLSPTTDPKADHDGSSDWSNVDSLSPTTDPKSNYKNYKEIIHNQWLLT